MAGHLPTKSHMNIEDVENIPLQSIQRRPISHQSSARTSIDSTQSSRQSFSQLDPLSGDGHTDRRNLHAKPQTGVLGRLQRFEAFLDQKFGVEGAGPERVLPEDRKPPPLWVMPSVWAGATLNLSCFVSGLLGWELGLTFTQSFWTILLGTLAGSAVTGWCAILGPPTGLRQVSICRYSIGWHPAKVIAFLNIITALGFSAVSCIAAGFAFNALSGNRLSPSFGIALTSFNATFFSLFGLKGVMYYEKYAWIACLFIFAVIYLEVIPYADVTTIPSTAPTAKGLGSVEQSRAILGLLSVSYGQCSGWASVTSDFYVHYSAKTSASYTFSLTTLGLGLANLIGMVAGALVASTMSTNDEWLSAYLSVGGVGDLIRTIVRPRLFASFILMSFVLSGTGMNCMTIYTGALALQQLDPRLQLIPRFLWTILFFCLILLVGILGKEHLLPLLENLLASLGYWNTALFAILAAEHYIFRHGEVSNYDLEAWDNPGKLPVGWAGGIAFTVGSLASLAGMDESWFAGPIAKYAGGDVGNVVAFVIAAGLYAPLRSWEKKIMGR